MAEAEAHTEMPLPEFEKPVKVLILVAPYYRDIADGLLAVQYLEKAATRIELFDFEGRSQGDLALPGIGTARLATEHDSKQAFLSFASYN